MFVDLFAEGYYVGITVSRQGAETGKWVNTVASRVCLGVLRQFRLCMPGIGQQGHSWGTWRITCIIVIGFTWILIMETETLG